MMKKSTICAFCGVLGLAIVMASAAEARAGWGYPGASPYYQYLVPVFQAPRVNLPYYAAHPPVYYSHIVPRPYGYSPHAYIPGIISPYFEAYGTWYPCGYYGPYFGYGGPMRAPYPAKAEGQIDAPQTTSGAAANSAAAPKAPKLVRNMYYSGDASEDSADESAAPAPLRISNPHVAGGPDTTAAQRPRTPQVVFPIADSAGR